MELRTLRYFVETADAGNVSAAANAVHVTQPALSRSCVNSSASWAPPVRPGGWAPTALSGGRELLPRPGTSSPARRTLARSRPRDPVARAAGAPDARRPRPPRWPTSSRPSSSPSKRMTQRRPSSPRRAGSACRAGDTVPTWSSPTVDPVISSTCWRWPCSGCGLRPGRARVVRPRYRARSQDLLRTTSLPFRRRSPHGRRSTPRALGCGLAPRVVIEGSSGPVAAGLAAAGRGVAVVSDDPRFALQPVRITVGPDQLSIHLVAAWDPQHPAATTLATIAQRLSTYIVRRYGESTRPPS